MNNLIAGVDVLPVSYLASPYADPDEAVRERRYEEVSQVVVKMLRAGRVVFSPIACNHPLVGFGVPTGWDFWGPIDTAMIAICSEVVVLKLDGWEESEGIKLEIEFAEKIGKPVRYMDPV